MRWLVTHVPLPILGPAITIFFVLGVGVFVSKIWMGASWEATFELLGSMWKPILIGSFGATLLIWAAM